MNESIMKRHDNLMKDCSSINSSSDSENDDSNPSIDKSNSNDTVRISSIEDFGGGLYNLLRIIYFYY